MRTLMTILAVLMAVVPAGAQSVIELRPVARLSAEAPVRLADVAALRGDEAGRLSEVRLDADPLRPGPDGRVRIDVDLVRTILAPMKDVNWSRLTLAGRACEIIRDTPAVTPAAPRARRPHEEPDRPAPGESATVRGLVRGWISELVGAGPDRLRVTFDEQDRELLDQPVAGRRVEIQPGGTSDRLPLQIKVFEGERIAAAGTVRAEVRVKRSVLVVRQGIPRGQSITAEDFTLDEQWLAPRVRPASAARAVGSVARGSLRAGEVLDEDDFELPLVVKKGDLVTVHCLSGLVKVELVARAMEAGRDGEVIALQAADSRRTFQARMSGPGRAVVVTDDEASSTEVRS